MKARVSCLLLMFVCVFLLDATGVAKAEVYQWSDIDSRMSPPSRAWGVVDADREKLIFRWEFPKIIFLWGVPGVCIMGSVVVRDSKGFYFSVNSVKNESWSLNGEVSLSYCHKECWVRFEVKHVYQLAVPLPGVIVFYVSIISVGGYVGNPPKIRWERVGGGCWVFVR